MLRWKIFYSDGTVFSSDEGPPEDAPSRSVAVIAQEDGHWGRRLLKLTDWYRFDAAADRWFDCDAFDVLFALSRQGAVIARRGEYMPEAVFERVLIAAHEDTFVPAVTPSGSPHEAWRA